MLKRLALASLYCRTLTLESFLNAKKKVSERSEIKSLSELFFEEELCHELYDIERSEEFLINFDWCQRHRVEILDPTHEWYPSSWFSLENPPLFISVMGTPCWLNHKCLSVVGSRNPTHASLRWMDMEIPGLLRELNIVTVSGGARGIDQKCHALSLRAGVPTVALLPSGLRNFYPRELESWREPILDGGGCFVSQFAPDSPMWKSHFRERNRLIAQMGDALLVVEAARRSGSIMTAHLAMEREKDVCILPGHPMELNALGVLDLLVDGAKPVRDALDLKLIWESKSERVVSPASQG